MSYYNVDGHHDLARDPETNAIINVNGLDYEKYIASRDAKSEKNQKVQNIEDEVATIKDELNEIKFLLKEIINGSR
jgi:hypothetical protein